MKDSPAVEEAIKALGSNLKTARLRRRLPQSKVAERAGISLNTLVKIENGDLGVAIGNYAVVILALGLGTPLAEIAEPTKDKVGMSYDINELPKRAREKKLVF